MLKATIVFCVIGVVPCTKDNAVFKMDLDGEYEYAPHCKTAHIKLASKISKERGNGEYFEILCEKQ